MLCARCITHQSLLWLMINAAVKSNKEKSTPLTQNDKRLSCRGVGCIKEYYCFIHMGNCISISLFIDNFIPAQISLKVSIHVGCFPGLCKHICQLLHYKNKFLPTMPNNIYTSTNSSQSFCKMACVQFIL